MNETQKEDFNTLIELDSAFSSTSSVYNIIYGMKIKSALDEIINNPLKILEAYDGKTTCARKQYKSVKQKMKENNNGWFENISFI